ncbi:VUT family protein [Streptosporangium canum]|uniref:VUT family protein n=1 Tax=Streptosporangium canum TaxID=324952 RepID=UPI00368B9975
MIIRLLVVALYLVSIIAANALTARFGLVPVAPGLLATAGTYAAGATLLLRDLVDEYAGRRTLLAAIIVGAGLSALVTDVRWALASGVAFALSELADFAVYTPLRRRGWARAVLASNAVGAVLDTVMFLAIAGLSLGATPGQLLGKSWVTLGTVAAAGLLVRMRRTAVNHVVPGQSVDRARP